MLRELCLLNGASGDESAVRDYIIEKIKDSCDFTVDALGSVIAFKKGRKTPDKKVMFCAHMDEVGFIITHITDEGFLKFAPVGGIDADAVLTRRLSINGITGVAGAKAIHLMTGSEKESVPEFKDLLLDIGAENKAEAEKQVQPGDYAYFISDYCEFGNGFIKAKALDDRIGCMLLIEMINSDLEYDAYFCFNAQEEVGLRGAACTAYSVKPDISVIIESTTAADIDGVCAAERCCVLGKGPVISYMDLRTVYDRELYQKSLAAAEKNSIMVQTKTKIAGGNDAGAVQTSAGGCRVAAVSLPCRYIHTGASVVKKSDIEETRRFFKVFAQSLYD